MPTVVVNAPNMDIKVPNIENAEIVYTVMTDTGAKFTITDGDPSGYSLGEANSVVVKAVIQGEEYFYLAPTNGAPVKEATWTLGVDRSQLDKANAEEKKQEAKKPVTVGLNEAMPTVTTDGVNRDIRVPSIEGVEIEYTVKPFTGKAFTIKSGDKDGYSVGEGDVVVKGVITNDANFGYTPTNGAPIKEHTWTLAAPKLIPVDGDVVVWFTDKPGVENDTFRVAKVDHVNYWFKAPGAEGWTKVNPDWHGQELAVGACGGEFLVKAKADPGYKLASVEEEPVWGHFFACDADQSEQTEGTTEEGPTEEGTAPSAEETQAPADEVKDPAKDAVKEPAKTDKKVEKKADPKVSKPKADAKKKLVKTGADIAGFAGAAALLSAIGVSAFAYSRRKK
ncbi:hypothetical protein [Actinobaculum suis]|nr:hypothetical protein [Actinobaculum suis]